MKHWNASVLAILLASFPGVAGAQVDCDAVPAGPARTDCYIGFRRIYQGQLEVAAGNALVQSDGALPAGDRNKKSFKNFKASTGEPGEGKNQPAREFFLTKPSQRAFGTVYSRTMSFDPIVT